MLAVESADPVLSLLAALALAQVAGTALVVDTCRDVVLRSGRTLADIEADGPSIQELSPGRTGVALISAGPLSARETGAVIESLAPSWPAIVVRAHPGAWDGPRVPVRFLLPGLLQVLDHGPAVWQPVVAGISPPGPGPVLPRLRGILARRLLTGRTATRARWVRAWAPVWGMPWA